MSISDPDGKFPRYLVRDVCKVQKTRFWMSRGRFSKTLFLEKIYCFYHLRTLSKKTLPSYLKCCSGFFKIAFNVSRVIIWGKLNFSKKIIFFHHFWTRSKALQDLVQRASEGLSKLVFTCPEIDFRQFFVWENINWFYHLRSLKKKNSTLSNFFQWVFPDSSLCIQGTKWGLYFQEYQNS